MYIIILITNYYFNSINIIVFLSNGLRFDENLKEFHFYDCDICLQLLEKGLKVATIDLVVKHQSSGIPSKNFNDLKLVFFNKWNKKVHGEWPISNISTFYE